MDPLETIRAVESGAVNTFRLVPDPPVFTGGAGSWLWTADGTRYLDLVCGSATTSLGHGHPAHRAAIIAALDRGILHTGTRLPSTERAQLYDRLSSILPGHLDTVHLANSGSEAIETALKAAMHATGRNHFVSFEGGYHGRTLGALALTHAQGLRAPFAPWAKPWTTFCPYATTRAETPAALASLHSALDRTPVAAVVIEAVQGVSGVRAADPSFLRGVEAAARERGALLIIDEIWSGLGRSGGWFAFDGADLSPDLVALGKGLSASLPLSAVAGRHEILKAWSPGAHTSTFMGNPLACAAAVATLDTLRKDNLPDRAAHEIAPALLAGLEGLPGLRVVGAQAAVPLADKTHATKAQIRALREERLLVYGGGLEGECILLLPALNILLSDLEDALIRLRPILQDP